MRPEPVCAPAAEPDLLASYAGRLALAAAAGFIDRWPDAQRWAAEPLPVRLAAGGTTRPLVTFLMLQGHLRPGYDYLVARKLPALWREMPHSPFAADLARFAEAAGELGFTKRVRSGIGSWFAGRSEPPPAHRALPDVGVRPHVPRGLRPHVPSSAGRSWHGLTSGHERHPVLEPVMPLNGRLAAAGTGEITLTVSGRRRTDELRSRTDRREAAPPPPRRCAMSGHLLAPWSTLGLTVVGATAVYVAVIALTRLSGVRALAKMSSFDFAATVAVGSTVASTALGTTALVNGLAGLAALFVLQHTVAVLRRRGLLGVVDNAPLLVLADGQVRDDALATASMSRSELWAQLRLAGVHRVDLVHAVILETTGDVSVITRDGPFDPVLLEGVRGAEACR